MTFCSKMSPKNIGTLMKKKFCQFIHILLFRIDLILEHTYIFPNLIFYISELFGTPYQPITRLETELLIASQSLKYAMVHVFVALKIVNGGCHCGYF